MTRLLLALACLLPAAVLVPGALAAEDNAALLSRGAGISVTSDAAKPINAKYNGPGNMLKAKKPAGPIINDLSTGAIRVRLALPLTVTKVGIQQGDYKGGFSIAKDVTISTPGGASVSATLENDPGTVQYVPFAATAEVIEIAITSVYPPAKGANVYGTIDAVQVLVEEDLDELFSTPERYVAAEPQIMTTPNLDPQHVIEVIGEPRKAEGWPRTIWDSQDIAEYKAEIAKGGKAKDAYDRIVAFCEGAVADPIQVPDEPDRGTNGVEGQHTRVACGIANLGIGYALSGDERFAAEAKRMLLDLADRYEGWDVHGHPSFRHDKSKWSWQRLGDAIWLIPAAWGFDLIHGSQSLSEAERATIADRFVMPCVRQIMSSPGIITAPTNWSAICCAAVMVGARVCGDEEFYRKSIYGLGKPDDRKGGVFFHLDKGIDDDGMWAEGAIGYQFMAMRGLIVMAETLWHDGIDLYGYDNGRLKLVFDSPIWYCYPGGTSSPSIHDSGSATLFGRDAHLYQYAKRRYGDATYDSILSQVEPSFESIYNQFMPACDFDEVDPTALPRVPSILFPGVGFATTRHGDGDEAKYLLVDYGPNRSHGHPDKLNLCLYAFGTELFADAGSSWYSNAIYGDYYKTSLAHNTISANGQSQIMTGGELEAYGSLGELGLIRTSCGTAIPATMLDRTLLMAGDRLYDVYLADSGIPYTFDLPYHSFGEISQDVATEPWAEHPAEAKGYKYFKDPTAAAVDGPWQATWSVDRSRMTMHYLGEPGSQVIAAKTPKGGHDIPTMMVRRQAERSVFAGVCDLVPAGASDSIAAVEEIELDDAYAIRTELVDGGYEQLMVSFGAGERTYGEWTSDARVAFVRVEDGALTAAYVANGTTVSGPDGIALGSDAAGLIALRRVADGLIELANQGEGDLTITAAGLGQLDGVYVMADGARGARAPLDGALSLTLPARTRAELVRGEQPTVAETLDAVRRAKLAAAAERIAEERAALRRVVDEAKAGAAADAVPADFATLIQADAFVEQEGGTVSISDKKAAIFGKCFSGWNGRGHALSYEFEVPADGWYQVVLKYCREGDEGVRGLTIDGELPNAAAAEIRMPGTGGWSNGSDNWRLKVMDWPLLDGETALVQLSAGKHIMRLDNILGDGGVNLDWIVVAAPEVEVTRDLVER